MGVKVAVGVPVAVAGVATIAAAAIGAQFGIIAVAIAVTLRSYFTLPLRLILLKRAVDLDIKALLLHWRAPLLASLGFGVGAYLAHRSFHGPVAQSTSAAIVGVTAYASLMCLIDRPFLNDCWAMLPSRSK